MTTSNREPAVPVDDFDAVHFEWKRFSIIDTQYESSDGREIVNGYGIVRLEDGVVQLRYPAFAPAVSQVVEWNMMLDQVDEFIAQDANDAVLTGGPGELDGDVVVQ